MIHVSRALFISQHLLQTSIIATFIATNKEFVVDSRKSEG